MGCPARDAIGRGQVMLHQHRPEGRLGVPDQPRGLRVPQRLQAGGADMGQRGERGPGGDGARQGKAEPDDGGAARGAVGGLEPVHAGSDQVAQPPAEGGGMNGQRQAGQPERGDDRPPGGQVDDDGQQGRAGRPPGPAEHPGPHDAEAARVRHQHRGNDHRDSPALGSAVLGSPSAWSSASRSSAASCGLIWSAKCASAVRRSGLVASASLISAAV